MAISVTFAQVKFSLPANPNNANITKLEYFVDSDPGFGNGTNVPITSATNINAVTGVTLPNNLSKGIHYLFFRSQDANGSWSLSNLQTINIFSFLPTPTPNAVQQNILSMEYFVDSDPGFGKASSIPISAANDVSGNVVISLSGLSKGVHRIFARAKDANGNWSISSQQNLFVLNFAGTFPTNTAAKSIASLEYFMDTDPGFGNGTAIPVAAGVDITASNIAIPINTLANGMHKLYVRSKDVSGSWSLANITPLYVVKLLTQLNANAAISNITALEYFFDTDPGFGKANAAAIASGTDVAGSNIIVPTGSLSKGIHQLFVRTKNANGSWSISTADAINVFSLMGALPTNTNPSSILALEYFVDTDPGLGNAIPVAVNPATDITANNVAVSISRLKPGTHTFYARTKTASGWSLSGFSQFFIVKPIGILPNNAMAGNITTMEYYFDNGPGFGNANTVPITAGKDVANNVAVPLSGLKNGIHKLIFRSKDANGNWSISNFQSLLIYNVLSSLPSTASATNITSIEYFIDTDPGFGKATQMPVAAGTDITASNIAIPVSGLSNGLHKLFVRSKNANGNWSLSSSPQFYLAKLMGNLASNAAPANIVSMEYFIDVDPGFNKASQIPITAGTDVQAATIPISFGNLSNGTHRLFIRSQDAAGHWSITNTQTFLVYVPVGKLPNNPASGTITAMEYFLDSDPGFGKANNIPIASAGDVSSTNVIIDISSLQKGLHRLFVRSKDAQGRWSIISTQNINIFSFISNLPNSPSTQPIAAMEYFMDSDPGFGNGTAIPIAAGTDITASNIAVPLANNLAAGIHRLYVRSKNANGNWSITNISQFFLTKTITGLPANPLVPNIVALEYFMDNDPGFGNATSLPIATGADITSSNAAIPIATNLSAGIHRLYFRTKNANGNWSVSNFSQIFYTKTIGLPNSAGVGNIMAMEYFFDADPGYGNGTVIPVNAGSDVSANIAIPITSLSNGFHHLFIRSENSNGNWSITNVVPVAIIKLLGNLPQNNAAPNIAALEYFVDSDPGFGLGTPIAVTAASDLSISNYAVSLGNLTPGFHKIYVRSKSNAGNWSITNRQNLFVVGNIVLPNNNTAAAITKLEYFVDTDPGFGNATQVTVPASADLSNFNFDVSLGNIPDGVHNLFVRTYDTWGLTNVIPFKVGNSLPVSWLGFTAKLLDKDSVLLNWKTTNEVNNKYFVIEKSSNGSTFDSIGMVLTNTVQAAINEYSFVDNKPLHGISYYRIKQVDKDGKFTYSVIVAIKITSITTIHASPNPFHDSFIVEIVADQPSEATFKLVDLNGKNVSTKIVGIISGNNTFTMENLSHLANGTYILLVYNGSEVTTLKLIKQ